MNLNQKLLNLKNARKNQQSLKKVSSEKNIEQYKQHNLNYVTQRVNITLFQHLDKNIKINLFTLESI